ncbi:hypothetical protein BEP19_08525 [Ammoniphilus oxalaticus]|uniref:Uncharacterized protein n=1 Tax=Ammoniphilus oxalaticus TaxID=66863 RepID=A0A419SK80_9BACL|nr:hypothetical protein [Ammoniphilus oxalaticus]RKD24423.1 hypothetical protein BEP19_08525 [Ammoniphilus oxalaticus]
MTTISDDQRFEAYVNLIENKVNRPLTEEELKKVRFISEIEADTEFAHIFEDLGDTLAEDES